MVGFAVDRVIFRTERGVGMGYYITTIVAQIVFGILASTIVMWFSRQREYRADSGGARPPEPGRVRGDDRDSSCEQCRADRAQRRGGRGRNAGVRST